MKVEPQPFFEMPYLAAAPRGGSESRSLPFLAVSRPLAMPLLMLSDLQGAAPSQDGPAILLGEAVAQELPGLAMAGMLPDDFGVVIAGDLFSSIDAARRGANGDVRPVWRALRDAARWVVGVAGNHDQFGSARERERFCGERGIHLLDGNVVELDGLRIGGVSWISGDPARPGRRTLDDQLSQLERVLASRPEVIVLHEGPDDPVTRRRGRSEIRELLEAHPPSLVVCGHNLWETPAAALANGSEVLNVGERVLLVGA